MNEINTPTLHTEIMYQAVSILFAKTYFLNVNKPEYVVFQHCEPSSDKPRGHRQPSVLTFFAPASVVISADFCEIYSTTTT